MARFDFVATPIEGVVSVQRRKSEDARGFLSRLYCLKEFQEAGFYLPIAQINHTLTNKKGSVRGMHFQFPPHAEKKIINCLHGEVFDVVVDLRKKSPTFLKWHALVLSPENMLGVLIPEGVAHGFQALKDNSELVYFHTSSYHPAAEGAVNALDPCLAIEWPLPISEMSLRDSSHPKLESGYEGISV